jgi:hypothetical protein
MKISKATSYRIAEKLIDKALIKYQEDELDFGDWLVDLINNNTPDEVKELAKIFPQYFNYDKIVDYSSIPGTYRRWSIESRKNYILVPGCGFSIVEYFQLTTDQLDYIIETDRKLKYDKDQIHENREKISSILLDLGSYSKIRANFPEAAEFLPEKESTNITRTENAISGIRLLVGEINSKIGGENLREASGV